MNAAELPPDPDQVENAPHPRDTQTLFGHSDAIAQFSDAYLHDRLHSGWMISGPKGIGKATLAWKIAGVLLADPGPALRPDLGLDENNPDWRLVENMAHPRVLVLNRPYDEKSKSFKKDIPVDSVRAIRSFFGMSATDGGKRVVIVDAADHLNVNAANALLKELEEPPKNTTLLLITHRPLALLPTIRSRCRHLRLDPLCQPDFEEAMAQAGFADVNYALLFQLSFGAPGRAIELAVNNGDAIYSQILGTFSGRGGYDAQQASQLALSVAGKAAVSRYRLTTELLALFAARTAQSKIGAQAALRPTEAEAQWHAQAAGTAHSWANLQTELTSAARRAFAVNIDPQTVVLDLLLRVKAVAFPSPQR